MFDLLDKNDRLVQKRLSGAEETYLSTDTAADTTMIILS